MNLNDALRCLFLRLLRADRVAAINAGQGSHASILADLASGLAVSREKENRSYRVVVAGSAHEWIIPDAEFVFYQRGDRKTSTESSVSTVDAQYEQNLTNARKWLEIFVQAYET